MKKLLVILGVSLAILTGCGGGDTPPVVAPVQSSTDAYDWTKDPKFAHVIVASDPSLAYDESYDPKRVMPDPTGVPGTLSERIGYIENQWGIEFFKDETPPDIYAKVTHKDTFIAWLSTYIPYPIKVKDARETSTGWGIEVDAPHEKIVEIDATLKGLVDQQFIGIAEHPGKVLPQWDTPETHIWLVQSKELATSEGPAFGDMKMVSGSGSWHLPYIGIDQLVAKGVNLTATGIGMGIIDGGLSLGHEDLVPDLVYLDGGKSFKIENLLHGTAVVGASTGSVFDNAKGVRGVVQAPTVFADSQGTELDIRIFKTRLERVLAHPFKPRVVNMSFSLGNESYNEKLATGHKEEFDKHKNFTAAKSYRELFAAHSDVLFVIAAGNAATSNPWDNAAVQFDYNSSARTWKYSPLQNVLVVGANGPDNVLQAMSDWGTGVDISAPSGYMTLRCFDGQNSYYNTYSDKDKASYGVNQLTPTFAAGYKSVATCDAGAEGQASYGTSFAAPLVSGAAVLLFSADPLLTPKDVKNYLTQNSLVENRLRYAGERWKTTSDGKGVEKEVMFKPLPILDVAASHDAVIAHKKAIEKFDVSARDVTISIIDSNSVQDEYFNLVVNGIVIGKVENPPGKTTTYPVTLKSGENLIELRITNTFISDTLLVMQINPDGIIKWFSGNDVSYAWTVRAP